MRIFRSKDDKNLTIKVIQWTGKNWDDICTFIPVPDIARGVEWEKFGGRGYFDKMPIEVDTPVGKELAMMGDYIVCVNSEEPAKYFYVYKADRLAHGYEEIIE